MDHVLTRAEAAGLQPGTGYDPAFLVAALPMPKTGGGRELVRLDYTHFSVLLDRKRRLAAVTAVNIDGVRLVDVGRSDDWHLDPRVPAEDQVGPELYRDNDLDRGHLVRRRDPVWGAQDVAERANTDTFVYTNAAPQASGFNQSKELWLGLEDYLLEHARVFDLRLSVFTGPVFTAADPRYRGVQIPLAFWKVAVWVGEEGALAATGYVLDQSAELDGVDLEQALRHAARNKAVPPLGAFRTFQVPIVDIEEFTKLDFGPATLADRFIGRQFMVAVGSRWARLEQPSDITV